MTTESLKEEIKRDLPQLLRADPEFRAYVLELTREVYAAKNETQDRFYEILADLRRDREERAREWEEYKTSQERKWDEQNQKWWEQNRKWDEDNEKWKEQTHHWDEQNQKWWEQNRKWDEDNEKWKEQTHHWNEQNQKWWEQNRKWDEDNEKWKEQNRKWDDHLAELRLEFQRVHDEIMTQGQRQERAIGALGARWGTQSEKAFRNALAGILEKNFGVEVLNFNDYDEQGTVFGRPEQVELDIIVRNGVLLICELKSSMDKAGMYSFERKARYYEQRHQRKASRLIVISPMIDRRAIKVAEQFGIETYGDSLDVRSL